MKTSQMIRCRQQHSNVPGRAKKMSKIDKTERQEDREKQRPIQNFPDYLKYVAKKSKAGFDKVHEELHRIYSDSFSKTDKSVQMPHNGQGEHGPDTNKSKIGVRKRLSTCGRFWSSAGYDRPVCDSFISYIPEEREDLGSSTGSIRADGGFGMLSDEYDLIKQENKAIHDNGMCSATAFEKDKKMFDFDSFSYSMPHSELTRDVIYVNDRVLHEEAFTNLSKREKVEEDPSYLYAIPKLKNKQQIFHDTDDYINLPILCPESQENTLVNVESDRQINSVRDQKDLDTLDSYKRNTTNRGYLSPTAKRPPPLDLNNRRTGDDVADEDHDYLPPTQWTESLYENTFSEKHDTNINARKAQKQINIYDEPSNITGKINLKVWGKTEFKDREGVDRGMEDEYVPFSSWLEKSCENVLNGKKNQDFYECLANKQTTSESPCKDVTNGEFQDLNHHEYINYNRPAGWIQKPPELIGKHQVADDLYAKVVKNVDKDVSDGDYSVPLWTKPMHERKDRESQQTYSSLDTKNTETMCTDVTPNQMNGDSKFYNYTVDEVVECLEGCALGQLAKLCQQEQLDGEYFRGLPADDLEKEPFNMNWFHISKLFKVLNGWRPQATSRTLKR